jgi:hypothetical protein
MDNLTLTTYTIYVLCENINVFVRPLETGRKRGQLTIFSSLFRSECKLIVYLMTMHILCLSFNIESSKTKLPNCLKITETSVVLIVFNCVICDISSYTVTVSFYCSTRVRYQKCFIRSITK